MTGCWSSPLQANRHGCRSGAATGSAGPPNWAPRSVRSPASWRGWIVPKFEERCQTVGFDAYATDNLWQLIDEQRTATSAVPSDTTLVVERFRDELGDWRVILHSPYGLRVHGPLALAVGKRLYERYGIDEKPTASDDGIIVRLARHRRHRTRRRHLRVRPRRDRAAGHHRGQRFGTVRLPVPGMRRPGTAAATPSPRQAITAVASAPARRATARRRPRLPRLPDRAGGSPRMSAGRLRRADADLADGADRPAPGADAGGRDRRRRRRSRRRCCSATSAHSCTRATARWPNAAPPHCLWIPTLLAELLGRVELRELLDADVVVSTSRASCST